MSWVPRLFAREEIQSEKFCFLLMTNIFGFPWRLSSLRLFFNNWSFPCHKIIFPRRYWTIDRPTMALRCMLRQPNPIPVFCSCNFCHQRFGKTWNCRWPGTATNYWKRTRDDDTIGKRVSNFINRRRISSDSTWFCIVLLNISPVKAKKNILPLIWEVFLSISCID